MKIEHIGIWCHDLENMVDFYTKWLDFDKSPLYYNPMTQFSSYFLTHDHGPRIELMHLPILQKAEEITHNKISQGFAHIAFSLGSEQAVRDKTEEMYAAGIIILSEPRHTGDRYFESVVLDPEKNRIELTI